LAPVVVKGLSGWATPSLRHCSLFGLTALVSGKVF